MDDSFDHHCEDPHGEPVASVNGVGVVYLIVYCHKHHDKKFHVVELADGPTLQAACILHDVSFLEALAFAGNVSQQQCEQEIDTPAGEALLKRGQRLAITGDIIVSA